MYVSNIHYPYLRATFWANLTIFATVIDLQILPHNFWEPYLFDGLRNRDSASQSGILHNFGNLTYLPEPHFTQFWEPHKLTQPVRRELLLLWFEFCTILGTSPTYQSRLLHYFCEPHRELNFAQFVGTLQTYTANHRRVTSIMIWYGWVLLYIPFTTQVPVPKCCSFKDWLALLLEPVKLSRR